MYKLFIEIIPASSLKDINLMMWFADIAAEFVRLEYPGSSHFEVQITRINRQKVIFSIIYLP